MAVCTSRRQAALALVLTFLVWTLPTARGANGDAPSEEGLAAPELIAPRDGMGLTDIAAYFQWTPVEGYLSYDIEIARDAGFERMYVSRRTKDVRYHEHRYFPR